MREEERLSQSEREAEEALSAFRPPRPAFDVARLMFEAARRAGRRQVWAWRGIAAALGTGLVLALVFRPAPRIVEKPIYVRLAVPQAAEAQDQMVVSAAPFLLHPLVRGGNDYLALRERVLAYGVESLPRPQPGMGAVASAPLPMHTTSQPQPTGGGVYQILNSLRSGGRS